MLKTSACSTAECTCDLVRGYTALLEQTVYIERWFGSSSVGAGIEGKSPYNLASLHEKRSVGFWRREVVLSAAGCGKRSMGFE